MHEVLVTGGLSLLRKSVVRLTDRPDMTLDVYCGRKTTMQQQQSCIEHDAQWSDDTRKAREKNGCVSACGRLTSDVFVSSLKGGQGAARMP